MTKAKITKIKPGITPEGYRTAVKDYSEPAVIEELVANSYDADASTVLVLLDSDKQQLHVIDDGIGFSREAITTAGLLGGGKKREIEFSGSKRPYLGAYGFGLKATLNIAKKVHIKTVSEDGWFDVEFDWTILDEALETDFDGFDLIEKRRLRNKALGTHISLDLINPTSEDFLDSYAAVLGNIPQDKGKFKVYVGVYPGLKVKLAPGIQDFSKLKTTTSRLARTNNLLTSVPSISVDLEDCEVTEGKDKQDPNVTYKIYFTGIEEGKVLPLKPGLRGIFIRIQGRLLKHSFTEQEFVYPISKWVKFASGLRVELGIDWLRNEISLSRDDLKFSNPKLEEQFKSTIKRVVSGFIQPQLKKLERKAAKAQEKIFKQRMELAKRRANKVQGVKIPGIKSGFMYIPESDGELALLIASDEVVRKINPAYQLIDYNDKASIDCVFYDSARREFVHGELEPTLMDFLGHKNVPDELSLIITWTLGKWRIGAKKKGKPGFLELIADKGAKPGHFRLLAYSRHNSRNPHTSYDVIALDQIFTK